MSETTVGSILGFMRLDASQFHTEMAKAIAEVEALDGKNVKVKVDTAPLERVGGASRAAASGLDATTAAARRASDASDRLRVAELKLDEVKGRQNAKASAVLSAMQAVTKARRDEQDAIFATYNGNLRLAESESKVEQASTRAAKSADKVAKSNNDAARSGNLMVAAIVGIGPAVLPLTSIAVGAGGALAGMGVSGILAVKGIQAEMAKGTAVGQTYKTVLNQANGLLGQLEATAARRFLGPLEQSVVQLRNNMPMLNHDVGMFATMTGHIASNTLSGVLGGFRTLQPLLRDSGVYLTGLSARLAGFAGSSEFQAFVTWARANLPAAEQTIESLVSAVLRLGGAFAPYGSTVLTVLRLVGDAINGLPLNVLQEMATAGTSVFLAYKTWSMLKGGIDGLSSSTSKFATTALAAAGGARALSLAAGGISAILAVAAMAYTAHAQKVAEDQSRVDALTDALIRNKGVLDDQTIAERANALAKDGTLAAAKELGYNLNDVTRASLGYGDATERVNAKTQEIKQSFAEASSSGTDLGATYGDTFAAMNKVSDATKNGTRDIGLARQAYDGYRSATASTNGVLSTTQVALQQVALAHERNVSATSEDYKAIQELNKAMDEEISRALTLAGATSGYDSALLAMRTALKTNKGAMSEHTQAGIADRQAIESTVGALQQKRDAEIKGGTSTADATVNYEKNSKALLTQMGRLYGTKSEAYKYAAALLKIPKDVNTKLGITGADTAMTTIAKIRAMLGTLHGKTIDVVVVGHNVTASVGASNKHAAMDAGAPPEPTPKKKADGGFISGPGTGTSDSIPAWLSNGEYVMPAAATAKHKPMLDAMRAGKFAKGGIVGYATGGLVSTAPDFSGITSLIPTAPTIDTVTSARSRVSSATASIASIHRQQAAAARELAAAETNLDAVMRRKGHTHAQVVAAENRIANARDRERGLTARLASAEGSLAVARHKLAQASAAYTAGQAPYASRFIAAEGQRNRVTASFLANIRTLEDRGFHTLAVDLLNQGGSEAETLAAQAVKSTAVANRLQAGLVTSSNLQSQADQLRTRLNGGSAAGVGWFTPGSSPGQLGPQTGSVTGDGRKVSVVINPSAGMSEAQLANDVVRRLNLLGV